MLKKYFLIFKIQFLSFLEYRANLAVTFLIKVGIFVTFIFIWRRIYEQGGDLGGYSLQGLIFYYLFVQVLDGLYSSRVAGTLRDHILSGRLSHKLVKPFSLNFYYLTLHIARVLSESGFYIPLSLPVLFLCPDIASVLNINVISASQFTITILFSILLGFNIFFLAGVTSFWMKESSGLHMAIKNIGKFFNGGLIPIDLLPVFFAKIVYLTPYPYLIYFPIKILMEELDRSTFLRSLTVMIFWTVLLTFVNLFLWKKGLRKYESVGI